MRQLLNPTAFANGSSAVTLSLGINGSVVSQANNKYDADEQRWSAQMASAQRGDESEYRQLLSELSTVIHRYLVSRLGYHEFIEDCVQEILLAIHNGRHTYRHERPFRPWLFAIVRNKSIDFLRKRRSYSKAMEMQAQELEQESEEADSCTSYQLDNEITQGRLLQALAPSFREAIVLTKLIGFSNAEAAERLNISETALKVRVHRGIAKLKSLFEADVL